MKLAHCGLLILLTAPFAIVSARQSQSPVNQNGHGQTDTLAEAARKAREKQKEQPKAAKVWDNDNIPTSGGVDVIGPAPSSSASGSANAAQSGETEAGEQKAGAAAAEKKSDLEAQLKSAKTNLKDLENQLDFMQRKLVLDQHDFYQNPNYASDDAGAQKLKNEQAQIDSKRQEVADAQKKVDDLTAKVQAAGGKDSGSSAAK